MRLDCRNCGMRARPYDAMCRFCNQRVQDDAEAAAKRAEWDAAPAEVIADLDKLSALLESQYRDYIAWLKKYRNLQMVLAAILFSIPLSMTAINLSWFCLLVDLAGGAAIGWQLNKVRGGRFHAMGLFGAAGIVSILVKIFTRPGGLEEFLAQARSLAGGMTIVALPACGLLVATVVGGFLGLKMEFDHEASS